jgi:beta-mannosidase
VIKSNIKLNGEWLLTCEETDLSINCSLPNDIHSILVKNNHIPDPNFARNEALCRWGADKTWTASHEFVLPEAGPRFLQMDYIDTCADIKINGQTVFHTENCFRRYLINISDFLHLGGNTIEIHFLPNTQFANKKQKNQSYFIPYIHWNTPIPNGNMLRKPACHFGWDWNLAIAPFGAYGLMELISGDTPQFSVFHVHQTRLENNRMRVDIAYEVTWLVERTSDVPHHITLDGKAGERGKSKNGRQHVSFLIDDAKLWWPVGMGEQPLYELKLECNGFKESRRIGLRTIEHIDEPDDVGRRFGFRVNGIEVFCRGANWIPADALPSNITPERCRMLLQAAVDANMNMIRVWGGGYYEKDWFYDICDELGLLVWQDFMFSCHLYPATAEFLTEVEHEVREQVTRLGHHACIALWCGDNELIGALTWYPESQKNRDRYLVAYDRLNQTIERTAKSVDPKLRWWPSSPCAGPLDFGDAWHDDTKGDMHFWSVWHESKDFAHYRDVKPRFCSEFGFQSFPSMRMCKRFIETEADLDISSDVMMHHQRNAGGNERIAETMSRYFRTPKRFENFVYVSQIQHGYAMQTAIDYWRSLKPHCLGTLMWQLNDSWPAASWSGLDHDGGWKAMHHMAEIFYAPITVVAIPDKENTKVEFFAINDTNFQTSVRVDLDIITMGHHVQRLMSFSSDAPIDRSISLGIISAAQVPPDAMLFWTWNGKRRHFSFAPYKDIQLPEPDIGIDVKQGENSLDITVTSKQLALFVMLECDVSGRFSENVFDLYPSDARSLRFTPNNPAELQRAADTLVVRDLYSSSQ